MNKERIMEEIERTKDGFCELFYNCANKAINILEKNPNVFSYPAGKQIVGNEGRFIAGFCQKYMGKLDEKSEEEFAQLLRDEADNMYGFPTTKVKMKK